jgi:voltage-gated potassium channel
MVRLRNAIHLLEVGGLLATVLLVGTVGFVWFEGMSVADAFHVTVATITTVGYGDPVIATPEGRMFSNALMIFGVGIALYAFWIVADITMGAHIRRTLGVRTYRREIGKMKGHIIVCGYGRVGQAVGSRLMEMGKDFVAVCREEHHFAHLKKDIPRIVGDATDEDILRKAGIERAEAVLLALGDDSDTVLAIVTVKAMNPKAKVFVRASRAVNARKMLQVGADEVIVPEEEGGRRMADYAMRSSI